MLIGSHGGVVVEGKVDADAAASLADYPGLKSLMQSSITGEHPPPPPRGICRDQHLQNIRAALPSRAQAHQSDAVCTDALSRCGQAVAALMAATGRKKCCSLSGSAARNRRALQKSSCEWREREREKGEQNRWKGGFLQADGEDALTCWAQENGEAAHGYICLIFTTLEEKLRGKRLGGAIIEIYISVSGNKLLARWHYPVWGLADKDELGGGGGWRGWGGHWARCVES